VKTDRSVGEQDAEENIWTEVIRTDETRADKTIFVWKLG
jgi:hypothetical protein